MTKERLDGFLVKIGMVSSRSQAQQLIRDGVVIVNGSTVSKPSLKVDEGDDLKIVKDTLWVGRGAEKMAGAHEDFGFSFRDKITADMGASTGGFVQYALHHGAGKVYAIDVGTNQLAKELRADSRVINLEGTNIKNGLDLGEKCDLIVVDLSFISLKLVLLPVLNCLKTKGELVVLVKPQFEVGREFIGKKGLVKNHQAVYSALSGVFKYLSEQGCPVVMAAPCRLKGKTGNQEYFFYCIYDDSGASYSLEQLRTLIEQ